MPKKETSLTKYDARLAELAKSAKKTEANVGGGGNFLSLRGGVLQYAGAAIPDNTMQVIVIRAILENQLYEGKYDSDSPQSPNCYAFGLETDEMKPNPLHVLEPKSDDCPSCSYLEWGSADTGRGKACKEVRRMALITQGDLDNLEDAEVAFLKVPVMSVKGWAGLVRQLDEVYHKPPLAFVTEIRLVPDKKSQFRLDFKMVEPIEDASMLAWLLKKHDELALPGGMDFPYPKLESPPERPARRAAPARAAAPKTMSRKTAPAVATPKVGLRKPVKPPKY